MKKYLIITLFLTYLFHTSYAQEADKVAFQVRMNNHVTSFLKKDIDMNKAKEMYGHTCDVHHIVTEDEIKARDAEAEQNAFIIANMAEYKKIFFPQPNQHKMMTDTFICDNGGFEDDFDFYYGFSTTYSNGSSTCTPLTFGMPSVYVPRTLPTVREFEIVTTGTDPTTGLQKVKFGNKSLKLNDPLSHNDGSCNGNFGVNKLEKRFEVTEENREFTVWYSLALENPSGHVNIQPFFSISCDLAPMNDLCFDADFLNCDRNYIHPTCGAMFMDVLDWTCHRVKIPANEIGNIATLEIVMGDCGAGAHIGYAYIDGICEECNGSALGSLVLSDGIVDEGLGIVYRSCDGEIATICGSITYPTISCGNWLLDSIIFPGITIQNLIVDSLNETFCFEVPYSNFSLEDCLELSVEAYFSFDTLRLPVIYSNTIEICEEFYEGYNYNVSIGNCHDNGTDSYLSDDYYFVKVTLGNVLGENWTLDRHLYNPYPNESGLYNLDSGIGDEVVYLGPFLRQEGGWYLIINLPGCQILEFISPPVCDMNPCVFSGYTINNVACINTSPNNTWSFKLFVPGTSGSYEIDYPVVSLSNSSGSFGTGKTIDDLPLTTACLKLSLIYDPGMMMPKCTSYVVVCPPKPCANENACDLEVYVDKVFCRSDGTYTFSLDVKTDIKDKIICYETVDHTTPTNTLHGNYNSSSTSLPAGPFTGDIQLVVKRCDGPTCSSCNNRCFKSIYIPQPDCDKWEEDKTEIRSSFISDQVELKVFPNPFSNDEFTIISPSDGIEYNIYSMSGSLVKEGKLKEGDNKILLNNEPGVYFIKYKGSFGEIKQTKIVKI